MELQSKMKRKHISVERRKLCVSSHLLHPPDLPFRENRLRQSPCLTHGTLWTARAERHSVVKLDVKEPHPWNGMADPYCYTVEASIVRGTDVPEQEPLDTVTVTFGYRSFHVDPNTGFWLNGKNVPLHGVSRHQDREDKGWAQSKADHEQDIVIIKEIGANIIRLAHY